MNLPNGWLREREVMYLAQLVRDVARLDGVFLEIGSWHGRSSVAIGREVKKLNSLLYCIDIWNGEGLEEVIKVQREHSGVQPWEKIKGDPLIEFTKNIESNNLNNVVIPIKGLSSEVRKSWKESLRFVFIDGCHETIFVRDDSLWKQFLVDKGIIAFHDYKAETVRKAVDETMGNDPNFEIIGSIQSIKAFCRMS